MGNNSKKNLEKAVGCINFIFDTSNRLQGERTEDIVLELFTNLDYYIRFDQASKAQLHVLLLLIKEIDSDLWFSISERFVYEKLRDVIPKLWIENRKCSRVDLEYYLDTLRAAPLADFDIVAEIDGIQVESTPFGFHDFMVLKRDEAGSYYRNKYKLFPPDHIDHALKRLGSEYIVACNVPARCLYRAYQLGEDKLNKLSLFLLYVAQKKNYLHRPSVFSSNKIRYNPLCALSDGILSKDGNFDIMKYISTPYEINSIEVTNWESHNTRLLSIVSRNSLTEIENRIIKCLSLYRNAVIEERVERRIFYLCTAIEALIKAPHSEGRSRSLTSNYSEVLAFMLGNDYDSRIEICDRFRDIYRVRSAVAHGEIDVQYDKNIISYSYMYFHQALNTILTKLPYSKMTDSKSLICEIKRIKFS